MYPVTACVATLAVARLGLMKNVAVFVAVLALAACTETPPAPRVSTIVPTGPVVPVLVYRPADDMAVCTDKITRKTMPFSVCSGEALAKDPPGTPQVPMMIYRRSDGILFCINSLNMEFLPVWRCS